MIGNGKGSEKLRVRETMEGATVAGFNAPHLKQLPHTVKLTPQVGPLRAGYFQQLSDYFHKLKFPLGSYPYFHGFCHRTFFAQKEMNQSNLPRNQDPEEKTVRVFCTSIKEGACLNPGN